MNAPDNSSHRSGNSRVIVVGAGIIGVTSALYLLRDGHEVILVDRDEPGEGCSFGNAGLLARSSFVPLTGPDALKNIPGWLFDPDGPLSVQWSYLPKMLPWLIDFIRSGFSADLESRGQALHVLTDPSVDLFRQLAEQAGCADLVRPSDYLEVVRSRAAFLKLQPDMDARRKQGFRVDEIGDAEIHALEPDLARDYRYGYRLYEHGFVLDPGGLVKELAALFTREGGQIRKETVGRIGIGSAGQCHLETAHRELVCDRLVLAAGAFSADLAGAGGPRPPLETERGYHITCPKPGVSLSRPVMEGERKFLVTPMSMGLRVAGTVELAGLTAPSNPRRIDVISRHARAMIPGLVTEGAQTWMGFRPTLPDSLPMIGPAPACANIIYAFGHQHLGLTCAPKTGQLVADLISDRIPNVDMSAYSTRRFL